MGEGGGAKKKVCPVPEHLQKKKKRNYSSGRGKGREEELIYFC